MSCLWAASFFLEDYMVRINGIDTDCAGTLMSDYLEAEGYDIRRLAVELNGAILPKSEYTSTTIMDGDTVEIVSFVGGG